jgi:hypothetical protein
MLWRFDPTKEREIEIKYEKNIIKVDNLSDVKVNAKLFNSAIAKTEKINAMNPVIGKQKGKPGIESVDTKFQKFGSE